MKRCLMLGAGAIALGATWITIGGTAGASDGAPAYSGGAWWWAIAFFVPAGFALLSAAGQPVEGAWDAALSALLALGLSVGAYFGWGFALQFGGLGLWHSDPGYRALGMQWSALGPAYGRAWGMVGLRGFFLQEGAEAPAIYRLFLAQLPHIITATMIPLLALRRRVPTWVSLLAGLLMGGAIFPLAGGWVWGGGWLAHLGGNMGLGHGLVDIGGAGPVHLAGGAFSLIGLLVLVERRPRPPAEGPIALPTAHLAILGVLGALLLIPGYWGLILGQPWPDWANLSPELMSLNLILAGGAGALLPAIYTWFAAGRPYALMVGRGLAAGLIGVSAGAPFVTPGAALIIGATAGLCIPLVNYLVVERLGIGDSSGAITLHGLAGAIGVLAPAFLAAGIQGAGWNGVGRESYLGVLGQGVTGLWAAAGRQPDWPGQLAAQAAGVGAYIIFPAVIGLILFITTSGLLHAWQASYTSAGGGEGETNSESTAITSSSLT